MIDLARPLDSEELSAMAFLAELAGDFAVLLEAQAGIDALAGLDTTEALAHVKGFRFAVEKFRSAKTQGDGLTVAAFYKGVEISASPSIRRAVNDSAKRRNFKPKEGRA